MEQDIQTQIQTRMAELPEDVRAAVQSADFGNKVHTIGTKHQLHIDQIGLLEDEVLLVMLAFSDPEEFVQNLVEQLHVQEDVANIIADEVSNDILLPIRTSIQEFMESRAVRAIRDAARESLHELPTTPQTPPVRPVEQIKPTYEAADAVLAGTTVTVSAPVAQPSATSVSQTPSTPEKTTRNYTTDPYLEPIE